jgi:hypothetical protein
MRKAAMDDHNYIFYLPFVAILVFWIFFLKRLRQSGKALAVKANKIEQYEKGMPMGTQWRLSLEA